MPQRGFRSYKEYMMEAAYDISYHRRRRYSSKKDFRLREFIVVSAQNRSKADLALIYSDVPCAAAAVYTQT